jgi:hypothetical protein
MAENAKLLAYWVLYGTGLYWLAGGILTAAAIAIRTRRRRQRRQAEVSAT